MEKTTQQAGYTPLHRLDDSLSVVPAEPDIFRRGDRVLVRRANGDEHGTVARDGQRAEPLVQVTLDRGSTFPFLSRVLVLL